MDVIQVNDCGIVQRILELSAGWSMFAATSSRASACHRDSRLVNHLCRGAKWQLVVREALAEIGAQQGGEAIARSIGIVSEEGRPQTICRSLGQVLQAGTDARVRSSQQSRR